MAYRESYSTSTADIERERELYRYIQAFLLAPPHIRKPTDHIDAYRASFSLSRAVAPALEYATSRCRVFTTTLNVMDRSKMYSPLQANAATCHGTIMRTHDPAVEGCEHVSMKGTVCEQVLHLTPNKADPYPILHIADMSLDHRFQELEVVKSGPRLKYYAGTPLITRGGIAIGTLAIMDTEARNEVTDDERLCLGQTATHIMAYLEMNRLAMEGLKARQMSQAFNAFVSGEQGTVGYDIKTVRTGQTNGTNVASPIPVPRAAVAQNIEPEDQISAPPSDMAMLTSDTLLNPLKRKLPPSFSSTINSRSRSSSPTSGSSQMSSVKAQSLQSEENARNMPNNNLYSRAACLIGEAFEMRDKDGVVFLDIGKGAIGMNTFADSNENEYQDLEECNGSRKDTISVLGQFTACASADEVMYTLTEISWKLMRHLLRKYPRGHLWSLPQFENIAPTSNGETVNRTRSEPLPVKSMLSKAEVNKVRKAFPGACQVLMSPVFDPLSDRFIAVCFAWSINESLLFQGPPDLSYMNTFCDAIVKDQNRRDALLTVKQKADFVGVVSHEMRSPLHGILASLELLADSEISSYQRSLVETIDSCGRTLLHTIDHVLEFSKIKTSENIWQASKKTEVKDVAPQTLLRSQSDVPDPEPAVPSSIVLTDVSVLLEEVVEGVVVGRQYASTAGSLISSWDALVHNSKVESTLGTTSTASDKSPPVADSVKVILDIESADWVFPTHPGALRRIIMNLIGNSLKYTKSGSITLRLQLQDSPSGSDDYKTMILSVSDTGKGMSSAYVSSRLFVPFAQENSLNPGVGLGLSLVKAIVANLGGTISIESELGKGTTAQVCLQLRRDTAPSMAHVRRSSDLIGPATVRESRVAFYGFGLGDSRHLQARFTVGSVLARYAVYWCGMTLVGELHSPDIVVIEESQLLDGSDFFERAFKYSALVVILESSRKDANNQRRIERSVGYGIVEFITAPCGPIKFSKCLRRCVERMQGLHSNTADGLSLSKVIDTGGRDCQEPIPENEFPMTGATLCSSDSLSMSGHTASPTSRSLLHVLLVEDNSINLHLLSVFMQKRKYKHTSLAENGKIALDAVKEAILEGLPYDIIIMDISMPVMNGVEATRRIREFEESNGLQRGAYIVALTGLAGSRDQADGIAAGFDVYMTKPASLKELGKLLDAYEGLKK